MGAFAERPARLVRKKSLRPTPVRCPVMVSPLFHRSTEIRNRRLVVACGDVDCTIADSLCCVDVQGNFTCDAVDACGQGSAPQACDGPEDCSNGQQCCAGFPAGASCKAGCGNFELEICHTDADCGASGACAPCSPPGTTVNACSCPF